MQATASYLLILQKYINLLFIIYYFPINNIKRKKKKKTELKVSLKVFPVNYNPLGTNDIIDGHRYLMKETYYKICLDLLKYVYCIINSQS